MVMTGVQKTGATTTTSCILGCIRSSAKTRDELFGIVKKKQCRKDGLYLPCAFTDMNDFWNHVD